jgi:molybdenum cofactor guanylyltransferase
MTNSTSNLHILILSGGNSSRMGNDKSELTLEGKSLLTRSLETANELSPKQVMVSSNKHLKLNNAQVVADNFKALGPLSGIEAALKFIQQNMEIANNELLLVLPVDMPLVNGLLLKQLLDAASQQVQQANTSNVWCFEGYPMPLLLKVSRELYQQVFRELQAHTQGKPSQLSVQGLIKRLDLYKVSLELSNLELFINCNTPEDWAKVKLMIQRTPLNNERSQN